MTNFDYIMENMTVRDLALAMRPISRSIWVDTDLIARAWRAWSNHCKKMEGYLKNKGNVYSPEKPVNPFLWDRYFINKDYCQKMIGGHSNIVSFDTWLCKQYNPEEWSDK